MKKIEPDAGSFRDKAGSIVYFKDKILRVLEKEGEDRISVLIKKKLFDDPQIQKYLIPSKITDEYNIELHNQKKKIIIEHEKIPYISYPYEWSFEQLKTAAIHHLDFHLYLLNNDATLIDASAYNIQFDGVKPVFIDILSIKKYVEGEFWSAHKQFCENFFNPLILKSKIGLDFNNWFKGNLEGIKTSEIYPLLRFNDFFSINIITNIILMNYFDKKAVDKSEDEILRLKNKKLPKKTFISILTNLKNFLSKLEAKKSRTTWDNYSSLNTYKSEEEQNKKKLVGDFIKKNNFNIIADIGCNDGVYSKLSLKNGCKYVVGFDYDLNCLNNGYISAKKNNLKFLPLYFDATNPSVNLGWNELERKGFKARAKFDGLIALAFEHHLSIAKNIPLDQTVKWLLDLAPKGLIEFVPKNDETIKKMLYLKGDIFEDYNENNFKKILLNHTKIISETQVSSSGRKLFEYEIK